MRLDAGDFGRERPDRDVVSQWPLRQRGDEVFRVLSGRTIQHSRIRRPTHASDHSPTRLGTSQASIRSRRDSKRSIPGIPSDPRVADQIDISEGASVASLLAERCPGRKATDFLIRVNRLPSSADPPITSWPIRATIIPTYQSIPTNFRLLSITGRRAFLRRVSCLEGCVFPRRWLSDSPIQLNWFIHQ